jgi:hypothetical protein
MEGCACPLKFTVKVLAGDDLSVFNPYFDLPSAPGSPAYKESQGRVKVGEKAAEPLWDVALRGF